jgi:hypothetical protein
VYIDGVQTTASGHAGTIATTICNVNICRNSERTTRFAQAIIDDMESCNDQANRIFDIWIDGFGASTCRFPWLRRSFPSEPRLFCGIVFPSSFRVKSFDNHYSTEYIPIRLD